MQTSADAGLAVSPLRLQARKAQDVCWAFVYIALSAAAVAIASHCATTAKTTIDDVMSGCTNATAPTRAHAAVVLVRGAVGASSNNTVLPDLVAAAPDLAAAGGVSLALAVLFGVAWMAMLRSFAKPMVYATLLTKGVVLIALGLYLWRRTTALCGLTSGDCSAALMPLLLCAVGALYFLWLCCARRRIALTAQLLEQAVAVLSTHPGLFLASAVLLVVKVLVACLALAALALLVLSQMSVEVVAPGQCEYAWRAGHLDGAMYGVLALFLYWSVMLWLFMQFYVVSLVTGVWYYETQSLAAQDGALEHKDYTAAPVCTALRVACSTGFGTIAFSSLIVTVCEGLKAAARREARGGGWLGCLIACCIACIAAYIEFLTRFALTYAALTGDSLCASGRSFLDSCSRHGFLKVVVIDYLAALTLRFGAFVFGLLVAAITAGVVYEAAPPDGASPDDDAKLVVLAAVALLAWGIASFVLLFIAELLLSVVDAAYSCVVLDLDNHARLGTLHRPALAQAVLIKVKPDFVVVSAPSGQLAYAAASQPLPVAQPMAVAQAVAVPVARPVGYAAP